ncbi:MAG: class I SAM-dependent methyltransferase [Gemmatimonadaceae bacterium]
MKALGHIHERFVHQRRVDVLASTLSRLMPRNARVLDVGCGDGLLSKRILETRSDVSITGVDVLVRRDTHIPVAEFDGDHLPFDDQSVDVVLFVDVLHHTTDPTRLLREAKRVASDSLIIKDHTKDGLLAGQTLAFMDWVGNARHGVALPFNYWPQRRWRSAFDELALEIAYWTQDLRLYPWSHTWLFDRSLHFITRLTIRSAAGTPEALAQTLLAREAAAERQNSQRSRQHSKGDALNA